MRRVTYYEYLCVDPAASDGELRAAYRRRARELHPDTNKDPRAEDQFKALGRVWDTLKDPAKRANYDRQLAAAGLPSRAPRPSPVYSSHDPGTNATTGFTVSGNYGGIYFTWTL